MADGGNVVQQGICGVPTPSVRVEDPEHATPDASSRRGNISAAKQAFRRALLGDAVLHHATSAAASAASAAASSPPAASPRDTSRFAQCPLVEPGDAPTPVSLSELPRPPCAFSTLRFVALHAAALAPLNLVDDLLRSHLSNVVTSAHAEGAPQAWVRACDSARSSGRLQAFRLSDGHTIVAVSPPQPSSLHARLERLTSHHRPVDDAQPVDATGLVRIWAAERVFASLMIRWCAAAPADALRGMDVLELGAGASGLLSHTLARVSAARRIVVTDGNSEAAQLLARGTCVNNFHATLSPRGGGVDVVSDCLVWDRTAALERAGAPAVVSIDSPRQQAFPLRSVSAPMYSPTRHCSVAIDASVLHAMQRASHSRAVAASVAAVPQTVEGLFLMQWMAAMTAGQFPGWPMVSLVPYQAAPSAEAHVPLHVDVPVAQTATVEIVPPITPATAMAWLPQMSPLFEPMPPPAHTAHSPVDASAPISRRHMARPNPRQREMRSRASRGTSAATRHSDDTSSSGAIAQSPSRLDEESHRRASDEAASSHGDTDSTASELRLPAPARIRGSDADGSALRAISSDTGTTSAPPPVSVTAAAARGNSSGKYARKYQRRRARAVATYADRYMRMLQAVASSSTFSEPQSECTVPPAQAVLALQSSLATSDDDHVAIAQTMLWLVDAATAAAHDDAPAAPYPLTSEAYPDIVTMDATARYWAADANTDAGTGATTLTGDTSNHDVPRASVSRSRSPHGMERTLANASPTDGVDAASGESDSVLSAREIHPCTHCAACTQSSTWTPVSSASEHVPSHLQPAYDASFHLIVAADVLFFEQSHDDLVHALWVLLRGDAAGPPVPHMRFDAHVSDAQVRSAYVLERFTPPPEAFGARRSPLPPQAWILAPHRGGSLHRFVRRALTAQVSLPNGAGGDCSSSAWPAFTVRVYDDIDEELTERHCGLVASSAAGYEPDIHKPVLVVLIKQSAPAGPQ